MKTLCPPLGLILAALFLPTAFAQDAGFCATNSTRRSSKPRRMQQQGKIAQAVPFYEKAAALC